jgi:hypothetical protein
LMTTMKKMMMKQIYLASNLQQRYFHNVQRIRPKEYSRDILMHINKRIIYNIVCFARVLYTCISCTLCIIKSLIYSYCISNNNILLSHSSDKFTLVNFSEI